MSIPVTPTGKATASKYTVGYVPIVSDDVVINRRFDLPVVSFSGLSL